MLPLLAFLAFVWFERRYLQIIYYDFTSQLEPQHRVYNLLWCACPASCGPRAPHTSRPADLAPCRPRLLLSALLGWRRHLTSPSMPLAVWAYFYNPRIFTDLPRWPGMLAVVPTMLISNGLLLYYFHRNTQEYIGSVRRWVTAPAAAACPSPCAHLKQTCVLSLRLSQSARLTPGARVPRRFVGCTACGSCGASLGTWQREARCPE